MLYVGTNTSVTVDGAATKRVCCESCGTTYFYEMRRHGVGNVHSPYGLGSNQGDRAASEALGILQYQLTYDCEYVPCPECGRYQSDMQAKAQRQAYTWMDWLVFGAPIGLWMVAAAVAAVFREEIVASAPGLADDRGSVSFQTVALGFGFPLAAAGFLVSRLRVRLRERFDLNGPGAPPKFVRGAPPALRSMPGSEAPAEPTTAGGPLRAEPTGAPPSPADEPA
ncbi:MAG TPA: hypothetical protein VF796_19170 [Humisphaera sp.]